MQSDGDDDTVHTDTLTQICIADAAWPLAKILAFFSLSLSSPSLGKVLGKHTLNISNLINSP